MLNYVMKDLHFLDSVTRVHITLEDIGERLGFY